MREKKEKKENGKRKRGREKIEKEEIYETKKGVSDPGP